MKPYFAKYLPVEGEIKEGEVYHSKWRSENKFYHYSTCAKIENGRVYPTEGVGAESGFPLEDGTKVKLFLCSRDIQVGDLLYNPITNTEAVCRDVEHAIKVGYVKKIGEISPEATWVKEGDEFDESEWKDENNDRKNYDELYKLIKCPCCNSFK